MKFSSPEIDEYITTTFPIIGGQNAILTEKERTSKLLIQHKLQRKIQKWNIITLLG